ncbi:MAG: class I SAM-dependent methyltransferase [Candidatus Atribacteria bacterium]|jgi:cyclopropane fatty-acyl-phospholipid synthase-like methyltransferase|nr:class I SAM-dependent methyltransferase [Candidatus Atribacteria bacterium]
MNLYFLFVILVVLILFFWWIFPLFFHGIPWQPTDMKRVKRMLEMAELKPEETLYDLGCGDGRILIYAAQQYHAKAIGIEINPWLYVLTWIRIFSLGLHHRVKVKLKNIHDVSLQNADVITIFLFQNVNDLLRDKFLRELKPGARIVSYVWILKDWEPDLVDQENNLYKYTR